MANKQLTKSERAIRRKYTAAVRGGTILLVGHQSFPIGELYFKTRTDVAWLRDQLAIALARMVEHEKQTP